MAKKDEKRRKNRNTQAKTAMKITMRIKIKMLD